MSVLDEDEKKRKKTRLTSARFNQPLNLYIGNQLVYAPDLDDDDDSDEDDGDDSGGDDGGTGDSSGALSVGELERLEEELHGPIVREIRREKTHDSETVSRVEVVERFKS